jgi:microcystin-dependent protein
MAQPYVGEIRMFAGNFAPAGWMFCEGQLLPISENETLFQLIGTTYGGDGESTFALPDLRGRLPLHQGSGGGNNLILAETGGAEEITLTVSQIPTHSHAPMASTNASSAQTPANNLMGKSTQIDAFINTVPSTALSPSSIGSVGGSQPHTNFQPYLCVNFIISLFGIFPSPT